MNVFRGSDRDRIGVIRLGRAVAPARTNVGALGQRLKGGFGVGCIQMRAVENGGEMPGEMLGDGILESRLGTGHLCYFVRTLKHMRPSEILFQDIIIFFPTPGGTRCFKGV